MSFKMYSDTQNNITSGDWYMNTVAGYNAPPEQNMEYNCLKKENSKTSEVVNKSRVGRPFVVPQEPLIQRKTVIPSIPLRESEEVNQRHLPTRPLANGDINSSKHFKGLYGYTTNFNTCLYK